MARCAATGRRRRAQSGCSAAAAAGRVIDAERQPLVTYSDAADNAWKAKIEGDYWPEPPRQRACR